jgi:hypothetical protein
MKVYDQESEVLTAPARRATDTDAGHLSFSTRLYEEPNLRPLHEKPNASGNSDVGGDHLCRRRTE